MAMTLPSKARLVDLRFVIVSSSYFFACGAMGRCKENADSHAGAAPLLRMTRPLSTPYRFLRNDKKPMGFSPHT